MSTSSALTEKRSLKNFLGRIKGLILIFLAAIYLYFLTDKLEAFSPPGQLGPAFWPKVSLMLLMAGCLIKAGELFRERKQKIVLEEKASLLPPVNLRRLIIMVGLVIFSVIGMDLLGFLLANFLFLIFFMAVTGVKKKSSLLFISLFGTILLLYLFVKIVYLPLPRGQGIFNDLTIYLYRLLQLI